MTARNIPPLDYPALRLRVIDTTLEAIQRSSSAGSFKVLRQVQRTINDELNRLPSHERGPVACQAGCDFCCHLRVMVTAVEVFTLIDFLRQRLNAQQFEDLESRVHETDAKLRALPEDQVLQTNIPCPVLISGQCSGYAGRPLNCRSYHSLSREACEQSFKDPSNLELGHPQLRGVAAVHEGAQTGFQKALADHQRQPQQFELVTALSEAMADQDCRARFERDEPAFQRPALIA